MTLMSVFYFYFNSLYITLQFQVQLQSGVPQPDLDTSMNAHNQSQDDEIDAALKDLQESLEGSSVTTKSDITNIPELCDYVKFFK